MKFLVAMISVMTCAFAVADTTLTYTDSNEKVSMQMKLANNMMRADSLGEQQTYMIYNADNTTFTVVMEDKKQYFVLGKEQLEALGDIGAMMDKMLEKQLSQMPESQRAMMRKMLEGQLRAQMPKPKPKPVYDFTGEISSVNGYECQIVVKKSEGKSSDFCVTDYTGLGMDSSEYDIIASFQKTVAAMAQQFGQDDSMDFSELGNYIPVRYNQSYSSGVLSGVSHDKVSAEQFDIPKGYKQVKMPGF